MIAALLLALVVSLVGGLAWIIHRAGRHRAEPPPHVRTAVVLGALVHPDGRPSDALADRVRTAVALLEAGRVDRLIFTGGSPDARPTEADVMAGLATRLGVESTAFTLETKSRSTWDNARFSAPLLDGVREIVLVTCDFHVARARAHFHTHALTTWPVPSPRELAASTRLMVTLKEALAFLRRPSLLFALSRPREKAQQV